MVPSWQFTNEKNLLEVVLKMWGKVFFIMILKSFFLMSPVWLVIVVGLERKEYLEGFRTIADLQFSCNNEKLVIRGYTLSSIVEF